MRQWLSRLLMLRPGEGQVVLFLAVLAALAGFGLSVGRASSDALFFKLYGVEHLPQMYALIALVLIPVSLSYAAFVDRLTPHRMFIHMLVGFGVLVGAAWLLMRSDMGQQGIALYFIAYGVISEMLLAHFNLYVVTFFDAQQAKRLLPSVVAISRLGATLGGVFVGLAGSVMPTEQSAMIWTLCLVISLALVNWRHRGEPTRSPIKRGRATTPVQMVREGLMFARHSRLMRITALGMFLLVLLLSVQEYLVGKIFVQYYPDERKLAAFFGWFSAILNASVLMLQLFLSGRLIRRLGLKTMNLVYPVTTLLTFGFLTVSAGYTAAVLGRVNTAGMLPGFRNTVAGLFYQALPAYMQGRARALSTGLVLPLGLLAAALFLWLVPKDLPLEWVGGGGFLFALALLWVKLKKNEAYGDSLVELVGQSVFSHHGSRLAEIGGLDRDSAFRLAAQMREADNLSVVMNYADMLEEHTPEHAGAAMLSVYPDLAPKFQDQLAQRIIRLQPANWEEVLWEAAQRGDPHLAETTARLLLSVDHATAVARAEDWLQTACPRLRASAAVGCLHGMMTAQRPAARAVLETLLASPEPGDYLAALGALAAMPHEELLPSVLPLLVYEDGRARALALNIWSRCPLASRDEAVEILDWLMGDSAYRVRAAAIRAAANLPFQDMPVLDWLSRALRDTDYRVRAAGSETAAHFMPKYREAWVKALSQRETDFQLQGVLISHLAASDIESKVSILRQVTERHVRHARDKLLILQNLTQPEGLACPQVAFMQQVLREEARRHLDMVLHILGSLDQSKQMSYIRAGLASRDKRLWAQALESAMQMKKEGRLFRELALLYEAEREGAPLPGEPPGGRSGLLAWLAWCQEHGSDWLAECANNCRESMSHAR